MDTKILNKLQTKEAEISQVEIDINTAKQQLNSIQDKINRLESQKSFLIYSLRDEIYNSKISKTKEVEKDEEEYINPKDY